MWMHNAVALRHQSCSRSSAHFVDGQAVTVCLALYRVLRQCCRHMAQDCAQHRQGWSARCGSLKTPGLDVRVCTCTGGPGQASGLRETVRIGSLGNIRGR